MIPLDEITFDVYLHEEDIPVRGNACASGNDNEDKRVEDAILDRLEQGDTWAWCTVEVRGKIGGLYASTWLGGCSYAGEADFRASGYYADMLAEVQADLSAQWEELKRKIEA